MSKESTICDFVGKVGQEATVSDFVGKVFTKIEGAKGDLSMQFLLGDGSFLQMDHLQICCEDVHVEDITGDLDDMVDTPILYAEVSTNKDDTLGDCEVGLWTFYKFRTVKGNVDIRFHGSTNSCYSIEVDIIKWELKF